MTEPLPSFAERVLAWFDQHGRKDLPWQHNPTAYRVWISEIMLQQTQVNTVIPYYERFMHSFPNVITLADTSVDHVLKHWEGLGYYSRARNLHKAAQMIRDEHAGVFPNTADAVEALPGIGRSTAGAILSLSANQPHAILDGNVKRVLARYHTIEGWTGQSAVLKKLWTKAEAHQPHDLSPPRNADYTQAMMDMGATLCTRSKPACLLCPLHNDCQARINGNPQDYPSSKPKKTLPEKHRIVLVLQREDGAVGIMKRPATGIWGGLWSFPEFEDEATALAAIATDTEHTRLSVLTHTFSHYRLHLQPLQIIVPLAVPDEVIAFTQPYEWHWYHSRQDFSGGLSKAVQKYTAQSL